MKYLGIEIGALIGDQFCDGQPVYRRMSDKEVELVYPYIARWHDGHVTVPTGFRCDLSSIPRVLHAILPKTGLHDGPSVIHDWCYDVRWRSRAESDELFLNCLIAANVSWTRRNILYLGVRAGGQIAWNT